ncbi:hypothetical protein KRX11_10340, partial [Pasteurellaceae bacterium TAE3-ERU1]|nr:hypothetical protein [Pasteurellaceae bacterium TAE3-ERU1]
ALSKSFKIAESLLHLHSAVIKALDAPEGTSTTEKFANMAAVATAGMNVITQLQSVTLAGARAIGGQVVGGKSYLVGERGPEVFTPGATGQITSNDNLNKALGSRNGHSVVVNQTNNFNGNNGDNVELASMVAKLTEAQVYKALQKESRAGGMFGGR